MIAALFGRVSTLWLRAALCVLALVVPAFITNFYVVHVLITICLYSILALSYNLIAGFAGQFSLAQAAFYGIGAYTSAILTTRLGVCFWLALPCAGIVAALVSVILAAPTLRLRDIYLTLSTLAFAQVTYIVLHNWNSVTGGSYGITGIPVPSLLGHAFKLHAYYYLVLVVLAVSYGILRRMLLSRTGRALLAMSADAPVAGSLGINVTYYRLFAFSVSAFFAGLAGSLYAHYITFISADSFVLHETISMLAMMVLGGMASLPGSVLGPAILILASEGFRGLYQYRTLIYGVIIVGVILFAPNGLLGGRPLGLRAGALAYIRERVGAGTRFQSVGK